MGICRNERGVALATAVVAATIVFLLAGAALNIAMGRFQLATAQVIRRAAFYASEAGVRYGFARMDAETANGVCDGTTDAIKDQTKHCPGRNPYIISSKPVGTVVSGCGITIAMARTVHEQKTDLKMGTFDVTVFVTYQAASPPSQPTERWKVCAAAQ